MVSCLPSGGWWSLPGGPWKSGFDLGLGPKLLRKSLRLPHIVTQPSRALYWGQGLKKPHANDTEKYLPSFIIKFTYFQFPYSRAQHSLDLLTPLMTGGQVKKHQGLDRNCSAPQYPSPILPCLGLPSSGPCTQGNEQSRPIFPHGILESKSD